MRVGRGWSQKAIGADFRPKGQAKNEASRSFFGNLFLLLGRCRHLEDGVPEDEQVADGGDHRELTLAVGLVDWAVGVDTGCGEFGLELGDDGGDVLNVNVVQEAAIAGWDLFAGGLRSAQDADRDGLALDVGVDGGVDPTFEAE